MLATLLNVLLNTMLIGSMLAFAGCCVWAALDDSNLMERVLRFGMLFSGALVVLGAQASGLSFAQLIANSLNSSGAAPVITGVVVPGATGIAVGLFLIRSAQASGIVAIRVMILVGMLATAQFAELYANALAKHGVALGSSVLPNISFVVGILLYLGLRLNPRDLKRGFRMPGQTEPARHENSGSGRPQVYVWPDEDQRDGRRVNPRY